MMYILFGLAWVINFFGALSLPFTPAPYTFVVAIQFNEYSFNGSVGGVPVQDLTMLRLGNWAACYYDSVSQSGKCLEAFPAYNVIITNSKDNSTRTIVQRWFTGGLGFHALAFAVTFFTPCLTSFSKFNVVEMTAGVLTMVALLSDTWLYLWVNKEMPSVGESVVTSIGPAWTWSPPSVSSGEPFFDVIPANQKQREEEAKKGKMQLTLQVPDSRLI